LLGSELGEIFFRVGAGAQDQYAGFVELLLCVTKLGRFGCSTGSVGFREEKEHHRSSAEIRQRERGAFIGLQAKVGGFVAYF
jgi:hypothetical protein